MTNFVCELSNIIQASSTVEIAKIDRYSCMLNDLAYALRMPSILTPTHQMLRTPSNETTIFREIQVATAGITLIQVISSHRLSLIATLLIFFLGCRNFNAAAIHICYGLRSLCLGRQLLFGHGLVSCFHLTHL